MSRMPACWRQEATSDCITRNHIHSLAGRSNPSEPTGLAAPWRATGVFDMNAVLSLSGAAHVDPGPSVILARLLNDAFEGLDGDIDRVRSALSRAVALVDGTSMPREAILRGGLAP